MNQTKLPIAFRRTAMAASVMLGLLSACEYATQTTSGADYLSSYPVPKAFVSSGGGTEPAAGSTAAAAPAPGATVDSAVRDVAAVEPILKFPGRFGLVRLDQGRMTPVPPEEVAAWIRLADRWHDRLGEFVPLNPLVAKFVESEIDARRGKDGPDLASSVFNVIRYTGARQHLDAVLVYEVWSKGNTEANALVLADISIIGAYFMPSRNQEANARASALLIDVRNGYPYGTASAVAEDTGWTHSAGRGEKLKRLRDDVSLQAVEALTGEVDLMFDALWRSTDKDGTLKGS